MTPYEQFYGGVQPPKADISAAVKRYQNKYPSPPRASSDPGIVVCNYPTQAWLDWSFVRMTMPYRLALTLAMAAYQAALIAGDPSAYANFQTALGAAIAQAKATTESSAFENETGEATRFQAPLITSNNVFLFNNRKPLEGQQWVPVYVNRVPVSVVFHA